MTILGSRVWGVSFAPLISTSSHSWSTCSRATSRSSGRVPEQPFYVRELIDKIPFYDLRHLVRPGMTGWRQVKFGYAGSEAEALEGLQYDFFYLRRQSLVFDLRIIGRTIRSVVRRQGR